MKDAMEKVREFHKKAKFPHFYEISKESLDNREKRKDLRMELIKEETKEYLEAEEQNDMIGIADSLADLIYVICGAALEYGIPLDEVFEEVQRSNMTKFKGGPHYREDGKLLKGKFFEEPNIRKILYKKVDAK
jgi:predicted HAD superfamily Cof-like phosphohydrolase